MFGPVVGSTLKLSQDSALFFQRIAIKTIGSADTSLLSYTTSNESENKQSFIDAYNVLINTTAKLISMLVVIILISMTINYTTTSTEMFILFSIFTIGYMVEILLAPYERILEVKQEYKKLWLAYTPYIIGIIGVAIYLYFYKLPITTIICIIHILRLTSSLIMWKIGKHLLKKEYNI